MAIPAPPENVVPTVNRNDKITLTWDHDPIWFAFNGDDASLGGYNEGLWYSSESVDSFDIEIIRDGTSWVAPTGGPTSVSYNPNSTSYSEAYYPNSDQPYNTQVGIDSSFKFRVRAVNADGVSNWVTSSEVYTQAIPPHNPSVSRPSANEVKIDMERQTNIGSGVVIEARADTGSGYGAWDWFDTTEVSNLPNTYQTETKYSGGWELKEDARYQFRAYHHVSQDRSMDSTEVILDYGNDGNVYFEDDFESNDLSAWRNTPGAYTSSGSGMDSGFSGADQGTYYAILDGDSKIDVSVGDLSNESDVIVKAAVAVGSADHSGEELAVDFYDGSNWRQLTDFHWEYNKQGWVEMTALVPDSYLSSNAYIRFESSSGGGGDHYYIDRVVVSDILHEYTKPASPSSPSADTSTEREITWSWTNNSSFAGEKFFTRVYGSGDSFTKNFVSNPWTQTELSDGEKYEGYPSEVTGQPRNGDTNTWFRANGPTITATTILPSPSATSISVSSDTSLDISWTDNTNNEDGHRVYYREVGSSTWNQFSDLGSDVTSELINSLSQNTEYEVYIENYTEHVSSQSSIVSEETYLNELRSTTSYKSLSDSSSIRTTDILESISSHANLSDSSSKRVTDVLASPLSQSNKISSASNRNGISFEGRVSDSHSNAIDAKTQRVVDLLESVASSTAISGGGSTRGPLNLENRKADNTWSEKATSGNKRVIDLLESVSSHSSKINTGSKRVVGLFKPVSSHSQPNDSGSIRVVDLSEAVTSHSNSSDSNSIRVIDLIESIASSSSAIESKSSRIVGLLKSVSSHSKLGGSDSIRVIDFKEPVSSHSNVLDSESMGIINLLESVSSYSKGSRSYSYNERTSLELSNHTVSWDDDEAVWYTNWFKESKIVGNEDELAIRSLVIDDAKDPAAIVKIQYDENGNGKIDDESEPIELGKKHLVETVTNIPIDETGFYRIKVMEYSGYNSLHTLDTAMVH